jgi:PAS domain S-box-containing protein
MKPLPNFGEARRLQAVMSSAPIGAALIENKGRFLSVNQALIDMVGAPNEQAMLDQLVYEPPSYQSDKIREMIERIDRHEPEVNFDAQWESAWGKKVSARVFATKLTDAGGDALYQVFYEDLLGPSDDSEVWMAPLNTKRSHLFSGELRRKDGSIYPASGVVQKIFFKGDPAYLIIAQDVTQAIASDTALTQARLFLNAAPDPTVVLDSHGTIVFANQRTETLIGFSQVDLVGVDMHEIWPTMDELGSDIGYVQPVLPSVCKPNEGVIQRFLHRDGSSVPVETTFCQIRTPDEMLIGVSCRDVSKRLATEEALKKAKEQAEHAT